MLADDDVARLDVAVKNAAAVRVIDRIADVDKPAQQLAQSQRSAARVAFERFIGVEAVDRLLEAISFDEPHGIERAAVGVSSQAVDRHDARMLQPAGDFRFEHEPLAAGRVVGVLLQDLLERHFAMELLIESNEHRPQAAAGMRAEHPESLAVGCGGADCKSGGAIGFVVDPGRGPGEMADCGRDVGIGQASQPLARRPSRRDGGQALFDVTAVPVAVRRRESFEQRAVRRIEVPERNQVLGQRP